MNTLADIYNCIMKIIVTGATGMAGAEVVRQALLDSRITHITAISRSPLTITDTRLTSIIHRDYNDYSNLMEVFATHDAVIWCLGISQSQVNTEQYIEITYNYTVAAAKAMKAVNPNAVFIFLSGAGADTSEKSKTLFARIKGKAENALAAMPGLNYYNVRPAGIYPIHKNPNTSFFNKVMIPLFPFFKLFFPSYVIHSDVLARAMLHIAKHGNTQRLIHNVELKELGTAS